MYIYTNNFKKLAFYFIERNRYSEQVRMLDVVYSSYSIQIKYVQGLLKKYLYDDDLSNAPLLYPVSGTSV